MAKIDSTYHGLLEKIKDEGFKYEDPNRKGVYRYQIPSYQMVHNFADGFPAVTTKKLYWKAVVGELLWFLRGDTNIKYLDDNKIYIWHKDGYNYYLNKGGKLDYNSWKLALNCDLHGEFGDLDRIYGYQLRNFGGKFDQLACIIDTMINNPLATKKTVTFMNPNDKGHQALSPCHTGFKILVEPLPDDRLKTFSNNSYYMHSNLLDGVEYQFDLQWEQDSVDTFLGLPFNIASYALLECIIGKMTNMVPKGITGDLSNVHIYESHMDAVNQQLGNDTDKYGKCELLIDYDTENMLVSSGRIFGKLPKEEQSAYLDKILSQINISDFTLKGYESFPPISAEMLPYNK
jgi:thymidylate synthase